MNFRRPGRDRKTSVKRFAPLALALFLPLTYAPAGHTQASRLFPESTSQSAQAEKYLPLVARFESSLQDRSDPKKTYKVSLTFVSEVEYLPETREYKYSYSVKRESAARIRVIWRSLEESGLGLSSSHRRQLYQGAEPLVVRNSRSPRVQRFGAEIYVPSSAEGDELVMASPAPAYVPN